MRGDAHLQGKTAKKDDGTWQRGGPNSRPAQATAVKMRSGQRTGCCGPARLLSDRVYIAGRLL